MARTAYLSCELKSRDLDSRLLIAAHLLKAGVDVVVGQQWSMFANFAKCAKGTFLFKTVNAVQLANIQIAKRKGHIAIAMDEESLAIVDPIPLKLSTDPRVFTDADLFMFQNTVHRDTFAGQGPIVGNARVDLIRSMRGLYEADAAACRSRGPYILVNTNYALSNSIWGDPQGVLSLAARLWSADLNEPAIKEYFETWVQSEHRNLNEMLAFLRDMISRLTTHRIVIRPHPAEKQEIWRLAQGVEIVSGSNPIPWILGADLTVHTNSTTGLEAALLGRPCLNLNPARDTLFSRTFATNNSDFQASSAAEAAEASFALLAGKVHTPDFGWLPSFPENAAALIAAEIAARTIDADPVTGWTPVERAPVEAGKFTATYDEVRDRMATIGARMGLPPIAGGPLDDSLFLFRRL